MSTESFLNADILSLLIPIVAIVMGIGLAMLSLYLDFQKKREILNAIHRERMAAIEKGLELPPLPPEIFQARARWRRRDGAHSLRRGLILLFVGVAIFVALWRTGNASAWWGLVPSAVGLAYLISSRFQDAGQAGGQAASNN